MPIQNKAEAGGPPFVVSCTSTFGVRSATLPTASVLLAQFKLTQRPAAEALTRLQRGA